VAQQRRTAKRNPESFRAVLWRFGLAT